MGRICEVIMNPLKRLHDQFVHWYYRNIFKRPSFRKCLIGIAALWIVKSFFSTLWRIRPQLKVNLRNRYGADSWAVVTGGSDGIGKELCIALAKEGFNIAIVARNVQKMDEVCKLCQMYGVQTTFVSVDFAQGTTHQFYDAIAKQLAGLDVSILVNNAGIAQGAQIQAQDGKSILDVLRVNALSSEMMSRIFINHFLQRQHKSAIISVSSGISLQIPPYFSAYSASKVFQSYFTHSLGNSYPSLDTMVVYPFGVSTNMLRNLTSQNTVTAKECAEGIVADLKKQKRASFGTFKHQKIFWKMQFASFLNKRKGEALRIRMGNGLLRIQHQE